MTAMAAGAVRKPVSAQWGNLGARHSAYYHLRSRPEPRSAPEPIEPDVLAVHAESIDRYGSRKVKAFFEWSAVVTNRLRASRRLLGATSAHSSTSTIGGDLLPLDGSLQAREARQGRLRDSRFPTPGIEASRNDRGDKFDNVEFVLMP